MSIPKKHHYVPQFLLRLFADDRGRLQVHRMDRDASYVATVQDVGHTNRGHSLYWPARGPDHVTLERGMSEIEGAAAAVITRHRGSRARTLTADEREVLGFLIALQWQRSRFLQTAVQHSVLGHDIPVDDFTRSMGARNILYSVLWPWWARAAGEMDPKERFCGIVDQLVYGPWQWRLYHPTTSKLVVADNVVSLWGVADGQTSQMPAPWTHHGVSLGFGNCARITMPLAPDLGLIIIRSPHNGQGITAAEFNRATVYNSREFIAHHPDGLDNTTVRRALAQDMRTQRQILPIIRAATISYADKRGRDFAERLNDEGGESIF